HVGRLSLEFLKTNEVGVLGGKPFQEAFGDGGTDAVQVGGNNAHEVHCLIVNSRTLRHGGPSGARRPPEMHEAAASESDASVDVPHGVDAPGPGASEEDIQERKAEKDGGFAPV